MSILWWKNAFQPTSKVPIVLTVLILIKSSKSKISPEIQSPLFAMTPYKIFFKNLCLQHAKTQNILYHFPNEECVHGDWSRGRQDINPAIQACKPVGLCLVSWHHFQRALSLKFCCLQHSFFSLCSTHSVYIVFLGHCLMTLASSTSWGFYWNPDFTFTAPVNVFSGVFCRDSVTTYHTSSDLSWSLKPPEKNPWPLQSCIISSPISVPHGSHRHLRPPAWDGHSCLCIPFAATAFIYFLGAGNPLHSV